jgi:hypothetical protein
MREMLALQLNKRVCSKSRNGGQLSAGTHTTTECRLVTSHGSRNYGHVQQQQQELFRGKSLRNRSAPQSTKQGA